MGAVSWKLRNIRSDGDFYGHFHDLVTMAHAEAADVVIFPAMQTLELINLAPDLEERDVPAFLVQFAQEIEGWIDRISRSSGLTIVGGSHLRTTRDGIKHVCAIGNGVDGLTLVEKNRLTTYEREFWRLTPGETLALLPDRRVGVTICYDAEFPGSGRELAEAGALVLAIPAFTADARAFQRIRRSAHARAIENQIFVVHASLLGDLGREPVRSSCGTSAILTPSVEPYPESAIFVETQPGEEGVVVRTLDLDELEASRKAGPVRNWSDRGHEWRTLEAKDESA